VCRPGWELVVGHALEHETRCTQPTLRNSLGSPRWRANSKIGNHWLMFRGGKDAVYRKWSPRALMTFVAFAGRSPQRRERSEALYSSRCFLTHGLSRSGSHGSNWNPSAVGWTTASLCLRAAILCWTVSGATSGLLVVFLLSTVGFVGAPFDSLSRVRPVSSPCDRARRKS